MILPGFAKVRSEAGNWSLQLWMYGAGTEVFSLRERKKTEGECIGKEGGAGRKYEKTQFLQTIHKHDWTPSVDEGQTNEETGMNRNAVMEDQLYYTQPWCFIDTTNHSSTEQGEVQEKR